MAITESPAQLVDLLADLGRGRVLNFVAQLQQRVHVAQIEAISGPVRRLTRARRLCHPGMFPGVMAGTRHRH